MFVCLVDLSLEKNVVRIQEEHWKTFFFDSEASKTKDC